MTLKKVLLSVGVASAIVAPAASLIACGTSKDHLIILNGKTQIQEQGKQFASDFDKTALFKDVKNGASDTRFLTKNGGDIWTTLAVSHSEWDFPSAFTAANPVLVVDYIKKKSLAIFKDPKYSTDGVAANEEAEAHNKKMAGDNINKLIKKIEQNGQSNLLLKYGDNIVGVPAYVEGIGTIYNKDLFSEANLKYSIEVRPSDTTKPAFSTNAKLNTLTKIYPEDLEDTVYYNKVLSYVKENSKAVNEKGIVISGKESWAFTSKILGAAGISAAGIEANLENLGPTIPGDSVAPTRLTFTTAKEKLFKNISQPGIIGVKEASEFYIKDNVKDYSLNNNMMDAFKAGQIVTMPQGSWIESYLNKGVDKDYYGFLPIPLSGMKGKIAADAVSHWIFADQVNSNGRNKEDAKGYLTQAVNFVYSQYLTDYGKKSLNNKQGLNNPYDDNLEFTGIHPLLDDINKYAALKRTVKWGLAFNLPGVGPTGYERHNAEWTQALVKYKSTGDIVPVQNEAIKIWKNATIR